MYTAWLLSFNFLAKVISRSVPDIDRATYALTNSSSTNGGNTFPGVTRPFGMVKLGPDLDYDRQDAYSGYLADGNFTGFTLLHESGTGGAPKYGVVSQMPVVGQVENPLSDIVHDSRAQPDHTEVGYYRAQLGSGTTLELGGTGKAGLYKYTFPKTKRAKNVLVDVSHVLPSYRGMGLEQHYLGGNISVHDGGKTSQYYTGFGTYDNGWNRAEPWTVYFCGYFDTPFTYKTFISNSTSTDKLAEYAQEATYQSDTARLGALFTFKKRSVTSRVGVSFISVGQACSNVNREIPQGTTLPSVRRAAQDEWNHSVFNKVVTSDQNTTKLEQLYTALYFMHLLPTNKTGENPTYESQEPYYDDIFTFWDTHRCTTALMHILQPAHHEGLIRSMIDIWRHDGWVSDARSSFWNGAVQVGSNSDNVLADAYVKGVRGDVNWEDGFSAMVQNAEEVPPNNYDPRDSSGSTMVGRSSLPDWLEYGYLTPNYGRSVSKAVEYSVNDFSLATVAAGLGRWDDFEKYFERSHNWRNQWNTNMTALGFSGFLGPRDTDGEFLSQDPLSCGGCYWGDLYYEALPWEYSFNAMHDIDHLVGLMNGSTSFVARLEKTFEPGIYPGNSEFGNTIFNPGNEPSFNTPYLYNYVNRQDLAVERSRFVAKSFYRTTPDGLPGNSDAGAMESWLLWNMIGLYPITGQPYFHIGSPWFSDMTIDLGEGRKLAITTKGGSETSYFVQSLRVNGRQWHRAWVTWDDIFASGGSLDFVLGSEPNNKWITEDPPPSAGSLAYGDARKLFEEHFGTSR